MPTNELTKRTFQNVNGYFFQRQLGLGSRDIQIPLCAAELKARPLIAEIKHLITQYKFYLFNESASKDGQIEKINRWHELNGEDLYIFAALGAPCVQSYFREIFCFNNFYNNMHLLNNPKLSAHFSSIFKKLNTHLETHNRVVPEYYSYQYVNLMRNLQFAQAVPFLQEASHGEGENAMEALTELMILRMCALKLHDKKPNLLVLRLSNLGPRLSSLIHQLRCMYKANSVSREQYVEELNTLINLGSCIAFNERHRVLQPEGDTTLSSAELEEFNNLHLEQLKEDLLMAINTCIKRRLFNQIDNYMKFYCAICDKSEEQTLKFIERCLLEISQLAVKDESALLYVMKHLPSRSKLAMMAASEVHSNKALLLCAKAASRKQKNKLEYFMVQLDPMRDSQTAVLFAEQALKKDKGQEALKYYQQAVSPLSINQLQEAKQCLSSFEKRSPLIASLDVLERKEILLFMLERCVTLIDYGEFKEAADVLFYFQTTFQQMDTERPVFDFLKSRTEYSEYLLEMIKTIRVDIEENNLVQETCSPY